MKCSSRLGRHYNYSTTNGGVLGFGLQHYSQIDEEYFFQKLPVLSKSNNTRVLLVIRSRAVMPRTGHRVTRSSSKKDSHVPVAITYEQEEESPETLETKVRPVIKPRIASKRQATTSKVKVQDPIQIPLKKGGDRYGSRKVEGFSELEDIQGEMLLQSATIPQTQSHKSDTVNRSQRKISTKSIPLKSQDSRKAETAFKTGSTSTASFGEDEGSINSTEEKWVPPDWHKVLQYIKIMRAERKAPVDTMGCERTMEENVEPKVRRYQVLISLMLSSQTKDQVTYAAMERLKNHGLTVQSILDIDEASLGQIIIPVGFWRKKAGYIKRATQILRDEFDDDIPDTAQGLCKLPGVGQKMAYIALSVAFGQNAGIGVDTHVHRISNRLKWTGTKETKTPDKTREALEAWLPVDQWQDVNILLVGFGQTICLPINPKCGSCLANQFCPYGIGELNGTNRLNR